MLGVVKSIKIIRLIALQNKTPMEGKIAWGNHQKDIERMDSPPSSIRKDLSPHHAGIRRERSLQLGDMEGWTLPTSPLVGTGIKGPFHNKLQ